MTTQAEVSSDEFARARRTRTTIETARHEAGHVIGAWAAGLRVSSVWCTGERARVGRRLGRTQIEVLDLLVAGPPAEALRIQALAGDAAAFAGEHVGEVFDEVGQAEFDRLWTAAKALIEEQAPAIEAVAAAILASPDLALYATRDAVLVAGNEVAAPGRAARDVAAMAVAATESGTLP